MKKITSLFLILTLLLSLAALSGCHGNVEQSEFELPETFDTQTPIEILFWAKNDTNQSQIDVYKKAIESFEEAYPNVTVKLKLRCLRDKSFSCSHSLPFLFPW